MDIRDWIYDLLEVRPKTSVHWMIPALLGLGFGVATGLGAGILWAPQTGAQARSKLREGVSKVKEMATNFAGRARSRQASNQASPAQLSHSQSHSSHSPQSASS